MDHCSFCKKELPDGSCEPWVSQNGEKIEIGRTAEPSAVAETSLGELTICESCYSSLPSYLLPKDLYEIHYQFGLEFSQRKEHQRSVESHSRAVAIRTTADALSALASAHNQLGHTDKAKLLYQQALEMEPNHFMAKENLKKMKEKPTIR